MVDTTVLLALAGASSGGLSLIWNAVSSRREYLHSIRPKVNVNLQSTYINDKIECHLEIQNIGTYELKIKSFRLYVFDVGFSQDFMLGMANYNTNLFIHNTRILNKLFEIDLPFTYENLIKSIEITLGYEKEKIKGTISEEDFQALSNYSSGLADFKERFQPLVPSLLVRPFFLFPENIKFYTNLKKMPSETFPQGVDLILFDPEAYKSEAKKDVNALSDSTFRLNWERNPVWAIQNSEELLDYDQKAEIYAPSSIFEKREDHAILSISPTELGFPENFAPQEKRSLLFQISAKNVNEFQAKVVLWLTSNESKMVVFSKEVTRPYFFTATPRKWIEPFKI